MRQALQLSPDEGFVSVIPGIGGMRIASSLIEVTVERSGTWALMRPFVLGTGFAIAMYQLGLVPHHVSAVSIGGRAIGFTGASGAGKSTAVAAMVSRFGAALVCDDVARIDPTQGDHADIHPGRQRIKLCADSVTALGFSAPNRRLDPVDSKQLLPRSQACAKAKEPLAAMIVLGEDRTTDRARLERAQGSRALQEWVASIYRHDIGSSLLSSAAILEHCVQLTRAVPVYRLTRPMDISRIHDDLELMMRRLREEQCLS